MWTGIEWKRKAVHTEKLALLDAGLLTWLF